jgi:hypothetical protein
MESYSWEYCDGYNSAAFGLERDRSRSAEWLQGYDAFNDDMTRSESERFA